MTTASRPAPWSLVTHDFRPRPGTRGLLVSMCGPSFAGLQTAGPPCSEVVLEPDGPWSTKQAARLVLAVASAQGTRPGDLLVWADTRAATRGIELTLALGRGWSVAPVPPLGMAVRPPSSPTRGRGPVVHLVTAPRDPQAEQVRSALVRSGALRCDLLEAPGTDDDRQLAAARHVSRMLQHLQRAS